MKTASADIFELVKTLDKTEKRYFTVQCEQNSIGSRNNYLELFKLIDAQGSYNEDALRTAWLPYGNAAHFAVVKQQLYEQLLQALHLYHARTSAQEQIKTQLHQAGILLRKGLNSQCGKQLKKCRKLMDKYEALEQEPEYYRLYRQLLGKTYYLNHTLNDLELLAKTEREANRQYQDLLHYKQQADAVAWVHYSKVSGRAEADTELLQNIIAQLEPAEPGLLREQLDRCRALATAYFVLGQAQKAYQYNGQFLQLLEEHDAIKQYPDQYFSILNNYLIDSLVLGQTTAVREGLAKLRALGSQPIFRKLPQLEANIFRLGTQLELNLLLTEGDFAAITPLLPEMEQGLKRYSIVKHNVLSLRYLAAYLLFGNENYNAALDQLSYIMDEPDEQAVQEIQRFAHLLNLIVHYEAGHYRLLESLIESTYRYQKSRAKLLLTERLVLNLLRKINYLDEKPIRKALFTAFRDKLARALEHPAEARALNYFNFTAWAESHILGKPFIDIYQ